MRQFNMEKSKNIEFTNGIIDRYQNILPDYYYGLAIVHRRRKAPVSNIEQHQHMHQLVTKEFYKRIKQYEKNFYQSVTNQDNRKFISTMEQIYNQPGQKKQLIYLFRKFGVVTNHQKEWKDTRQVLRRYEEEMVQMQRRLAVQEEYLLKSKYSVTQQVSTKDIAKEVMESIKKEMRMERIRYGLD